MQATCARRYATNERRTGMEKSVSSVGGAALESSTGRRDAGFLDDDGVPLPVPALAVVVRFIFFTTLHIWYQQPNGLHRRAHAGAMNRPPIPGSRPRVKDAPGSADKSLQRAGLGLVHTVSEAAGG